MYSFIGKGVLKQNFQLVFVIVYYDQAYNCLNSLLQEVVETLPLVLGFQRKKAGLSDKFKRRERR